MLRADAQRNLDRLKAAALEVFRERGLGSPLEEIAKRAGVSVGTLYNRFGSREALIDAVIPDLMAANVERIRLDANAATDPWERVERYFNGLLEMQIADPAVSDAVARAYEGSPDVSAVCAAALDEGARLLDAVRTGDPSFTRDDLGALLVANSALIATGGADAARRIVAVLLAGLRPA
ncbi:TetR/AcrR family transcriptional regulator [Solirubrobacter phytolaccae]|uniref:TetR/AcrR family transcriptional regulator n=1 Tax=Solirubrobacter phytolaccae TaxID=1404360 RepID=A0A9X3SCE1_9ACTN|nr:TetR/AcrR family transcriptional regulator [Solirubrobacter phytolaccae]MDA0182420.1 TetR/AcrR family transcriptional regulator [Solirubrobacter phytolaccae]